MQYSPRNYTMTILKTHFFPKTLHHVKKIFCQAMIYDCRGISDSDSTQRLPLKIEEIAKTIVTSKNNETHFGRRARKPRPYELSSVKDKVSI